MPYVASYVDDGKGVHKMGIGIVTGLEIYNSCMQASLDKEKSSKLRYGLIDFTDTTEMQVTPGDVRRLVEMNRRLASFTPGALIALVAPAALPYAIARLWHTLSDDLGWESNVFHTRPDAIAWLRKEIQTRAGSSAVLDEFPSLRQEA
jgi:hypothetical protein